MGIQLFANVGNSDVQLTDSGLLPPASTPEWWNSVRRRGEEIRDHFEHYAPSVQLPLLGPTIHWLMEAEDVTGNDLEIILFASDQPAGYTAEREWLKDTKPLADVIKLVLQRKPFEIPAKRIRITAIDGNPADYTNMLAFYSKTLPQIAPYIDPQAQIYMEVSGGTPAMASMLIVMGVEVFGDRVHTLYVDRGASFPCEVSVARELFARKTRDTLLNQVDLHAYAVAQQTLEQAGSLVSSDDRQRRLFAALLEYADRRLAFDFERARAALQEARTLSVGVQQAKVQHWLGELATQDVAVNMSELIHSAGIKLRFGDYADFTQRLFRFQEASFRYMVEQFGIRYTKADGMFADSGWVDGVTGLTQYLKEFPDPRSGRLIFIDLKRSLNRFSLGAIARFFVQSDPKWQHWQATVDRLDGLSTMADLRNKGISGHGFDGIGRSDLEQAFGGDLETLPALLPELFESLFGRPPGENPYTAINALLLDLIQESA